MRKQFTLLLLFSCILLLKVSAQDLLYLDGSGANPNLTIQSGANVYVQGGFVANNTAGGMQLNGDLYVGLSTGNSANWTDNMASSSVIAGSTGTVHFESWQQQNLTGTNTAFYNVIFNNSSANTLGLQLQTNITVLHQATFKDGVVNTNSRILYINTSTANAIQYTAPNTSTYSNSWVSAVYPNGRLDRDMINNASTYDFPVGNTSTSQLLQVTPTTVTGISRFSAAWEGSVTGNSPITITECGTPYTQVNNGGEWHLRPANGGVAGSGSFAGGNMTLQGWNLTAFPGIMDNEFAILERAHGDLTTAGWSVPNPGCSSLATAGTSGRTIGGNNALRNNLSDFSDATSQLGIGMTIVILPIQLLSFTGWNEGAVNELSWNTAAEFNSNYFEVERSISANNYQSIGQVSAAGFSDHDLQYHFTDLHPNHGLNYYRLKLIDRNNTTIYSDIVTITLNSTGTMNTLVSPNPTPGDIAIQIQSQFEEHVIVELTDAVGRVLHSEPWNVVVGNNSISINTDQLPEAIYFIRISNAADNTAAVYKVVKQN